MQNNAATIHWCLQEGVENLKTQKSVVGYIEETNSKLSNLKLKPRHPSTGEWINCNVYIQAVEYYSVLK